MGEKILEDQKSKINSEGLWTASHWSLYSKLLAAMQPEEAACHGVKVVPSFPAVWLSMGYSPSLSLYFIFCNVDLIIVLPNFIIVKNK